MYRLDHQPSPGDLRLFGASLSAVLFGLGLWFASQTTFGGLAVALWLASGVLCAVYYGLPAVQKPLYRGWLIALFPLAAVMSTVMLGVLYFGLVTPIGWLSRWAGRDPLQLRTRRESYWRPRPTEPTAKSRYFRQH
jgi:hypothetical protein